MKFPHLPASWACLVIAASLTACSSSSKQKSSGADSRAEPRLAERLGGKWDMNKRSTFDSHRSAGGVKDKKYKTGAFHRGKDYSGGKKEFNSGKDGFQTKAFAQSDKKSRAGDQTFSGANDKSRMADDKFKTGASRYSSQDSRDSSKRSAMEGDVFRTRQEPQARKAMESNKRPYIKETTKPGYTEDEVKGILNKQ